MGRLIVLISFLVLLAGCDASASIGSREAQPTPVPQVPVEVVNGIMANANQQIADANRRADQSQMQAAKTAEMNRPLTPEETNQRILLVVGAVAVIGGGGGFLWYKNNQSKYRAQEAQAFAQANQTKALQEALLLARDAVHANSTNSNTPPALPPGQTLPPQYQIRKPDVKQLPARSGGLMGEGRKPNG